MYIDLFIVSKWLVPSKEKVKSQVDEQTTFNALPTVTEIKADEF